MGTKYEIDMCNGPLLGKILLFSIPLMLSGVLQLLFNAADIIVVGRYAGDTALAAVGATTSLINLLINLFIGLSVGTNVIVARHYGEKRDEDISKSVHTAIGLSIISGIFLSIIGGIFAKQILGLMSTPDDVIDKSSIYLRIFFMGMPALMIYNFGSAILRAIGDTRRPLFYLTLSGIINVILNLYFVIVLKMDVSGVALATIISQYISAFLVIKCLIKLPGSCKLILSQIKVHKEKLIPIIKIGIPAGVQGVLFSFSNVLIQSSVNSFGSQVMAGNTAAQNLEGFVYTALNSFQQTVMSFSSQNFGAGNYKRIGKVVAICASLVVVIGIVFGFGVTAISPNILRIYSSDPEVIDIGVLRMGYICKYYFICGVMDLMVGALRGVGYSVMPMIVSLIGACGFRILWIYTVFSWNRTLDCLYISYPISWFLTFLVHLICYIVIYKNILKKDKFKKEISLEI